MLLQTRVTRPYVSTVHSACRRVNQRSPDCSHVVGALIQTAEPASRLVAAPQRDFPSCSTVAHPASSLIDCRGARSSSWRDRPSASVRRFGPVRPSGSAWFFPLGSPRVRSLRGIQVSYGTTLPQFFAAGRWPEEVFGIGKTLPHYSATRWNMT